MHEIASVPVKITEIRDETPTIKTFEFDGCFSSKAGQFCMVWIPGVDEVPMGFSSPSSITVQKVGEATEALFSLNVGDTIGIKGPLGNGYTPEGRVLVIAGGVGAAPLRPLALEGLADTFILGARTADEIVYKDELGSLTDLRISTDDGSYGHHGFVTDLLAGAGRGGSGVDPEDYDTICVCGPEIMMKNVLRILNEKDLSDRAQFSLVRYMKCGVGICGSCCLDDAGLRVCRDGPVFSGTDLLKSFEFGNYSRDATGRRVSGGGH
ncbi:dihydroorotate dehydrogenase electron transfer subunit [Methanoplanus limicola]|uniref:Probable dihydroorotate dehydrogenase B (NAD(+)), electron transfer subunit n=1 Tax=Methanoplanus limicola DSM 2279 TaxID=937775 RepID=H1Z3T0_9EURY|nr:dihydroorotate dehydrogenase electron transfer subunit [Methanoplanus limicola]EHQ35679.1 dihydroorotate oxidase B, electron transfer subunit [Methanoplanus limicola DSM 2279]